MASSPFGFAPGPMSGLRRSVVDPVTGQPVVTSAPTGEVRQRSALLPVGRDDNGALVPAVPQGIFDAIDAARFPGQVARGEKEVFDPATGHVSDEAIGAANGMAGLAMTGGLGGAAVKAGETALGAGPIRAYHGSPHDFDKFSLSKIGTGEGAQAYGHGLYFAEHEGVARSYRDALRADPALPDSFAQRALEVGGGDRAAAIKDLKSKLYFADDPDDIARYTAAHDLLASGRDPHIPQGHMYEVGINADPAKMLDWDKPLRQQAIGADLAAVEGAKYAPGYFASNRIADPTGRDLMEFMRASGYSPSRISMALEDGGVPGIRYLDNGSRDVGEGSRNYVTFSDDIVSILRKYGLVGAAGAGAAASSVASSDPAQAAPGVLSASPSNPQAPMTAGSPFGFGPLSQVAPDDIAALLRRTPLGPAQAFAGGGPAIAMDEAETQRLERGMGMVPDAAPAAPLPPRRPFGLTPPVQGAPADVPAAGAVPAAGQMPAPAAPAAQPAAASAEPSFGDRLANGLKGNGDLLIGLGTGLMSTHGLGNGLAAGLQLAQKSEKDRAVTDLARAEFGLKQRKLAQETGALAGNAAIIKRAFPNLSDTEATAAGSNAAQVAEAMKILRDPNHGTGAPTGYRIAASGGFEPIPGGEADPATIRTKAQAQAEGAAAGKPEDTVSLIPETERAQLGLPPGSYQRDSKGKISSVNPSGTTINMGGEKAYDAEVGKTYAKKFTDVQAAGTNAGAKLNTLALMEQAMRMPDFYSGVGGEGVKRANQFLSALGFKDAKAATGQEVFSALSNQAVLDQLGGTLGAGVSNTDRDYITTIGPGLEKTPEGNKQLIGIYRAVAQRQQRIAQMARDYAKANGGRIDAGFDDQVEQYANANPLFPTAQAGATARSDGVGMGAEAPRGAPEGTRMAPDGRFYAPDPGRPGKFLMVR